MLAFLTLTAEVVRKEPGDRPSATQLLQSDPWLQAAGEAAELVELCAKVKKQQEADKKPFFY